MAETSTGQEQPVTEEKPVEKKPTKEKSQTRANIPKAVFVVSAWSKWEEFDHVVYMSRKM